MMRTDERAETTTTPGRVDRVTAWIGWHLPEVTAITGTGAAGVWWWPGWWIATTATAAWLAAAPLVRRYRARHTTNTNDRACLEPAPEPSTTQDAQHWNTEATG